MKIIVNKPYNMPWQELAASTPDNSIDMVATDPPYGLKLMGLDWDKALPPQQDFNEMHRVLKPGAFCFVMSLPRQDLLARMIIRLEDAGFNINFTSIYWVFATGFYKAKNMSKAIDKKLGAKREVVGEKVAPDGTPLRKKRPNPQKTELLNRMDTKEKVFKSIIETAPATPLAKKYDGAYSGYNPAPACEVILVAMKPITEKSYTEQVMKTGKGCTWLDSCRIPINENDSNLRPNAKNHEDNKLMGYDNFVPGEKVKKKNRSDFARDKGFHDSKGRMPSNILVSNGALDTGEIYKSGSGNKYGYRESESEYFKGLKSIHHENRKCAGGDQGDFSRYFDLDLWAEKNLPKSVNTWPFLNVPKPPRSTKWFRLAHQTEKPIKLFSYLVMLGSRPDDIVLDPYLGSGTTFLATWAINRNAVGTEIDPKYFKESLLKRIKRYNVKMKEFELK